jgi:hypothetical protein
MSKELVPFKVNNLPAIREEVMTEIAEVSKGTDFLHWGVPQPGGEDIIDLGTSIDVVPFDARAKAVDMSDKEAIVAVYTTKDPEFQRIKNTPKPKDGMSGCLWGPSFLVLERSTGKLYELFFSNKSGRQEAGKLRPFLPTKENGNQPSAATLGIRYKKGPDYGWHVPVVTKCSEPFDPSNCPKGEAIAAEIEKFRNPQKGAEKVTDEDAPKGRAR